MFNFKKLSHHCKNPINPLILSSRLPLPPLPPFLPSSSPPLHQQTLSTNHIIVTTTSLNPPPLQPSQPTHFPKKEKSIYRKLLLRNIRPRGLLLVSQAVMDRGNDSKVGVMGWDV